MITHPEDYVRSFADAGAGILRPETVKQAVEAGVDVLVAGSALFKGRDFKGNLAALRAAMA